MVSYSTSCDPAGDGYAGAGPAVIYFPPLPSLVGNLSSQDHNIEEDVAIKMNLYFKLEIPEWLDVFTFSYGALSLLQHNVCEKRLLQIGISNNLPSRFPFSDHANFGDLCRTVKKVFTFLKRTYCMSYCPAR